MDSPKDVKVIFWGTSDFALPALSKLNAERYSIILAVTKPDERVGRKQILTPPPVKIMAAKYGIPILQPERLNFETFKLSVPPADLYIVAAYGKIIPKEIIGIPRFKTLNIHPSLLPRWRGPSPIQYTILHGDKATGVTIMQIDDWIDHGPIVANSKIKIQNSKITYRGLHDQLAQLGAELLLKTIPKWIHGEIIPEPQDDVHATFSKILSKEDGKIDWSRPAEEIERMARAFTPWPGAWTLWPHGNRIYRIRIEETDVMPRDPSETPFGYVAKDRFNNLLIKTSQGSLLIQRLTLEGKKTMDAKSFLRGHPELIGSILL